MISAVLLAAGPGRRIWPYSGVRQKAAIPVLNEPIIRRMALALQEIGVEETVAVVGYRAESVRAALAGIPGVLYAEQNEPTGTAHAALLGLEKTTGDTVLVCYGDLVATTADVRLVVDEFQETGVAATVLVVRTLPGASQYFSVDVSSSGTVTSIQPQGGRGVPKFAGILMARKADLAKACAETPAVFPDSPLGCMPPLESELACSLHIMAETGHEICAAMARGFVVDVDKPWQIAEANYRAASVKFASIKENTMGEGAFIDDTADISSGARLCLGKKARIGKYCRVNGKLVLGNGTRIEQGTFIRGNAIIGDDCLCDNFCVIGESSVIGPRSFFGHAAEFIGVTFGRASIRHTAQACAVMGYNVNLAGGVMTGDWRFDDQVRTQVTNGHREKPESFGQMTFLGDYVRVGNNVVFSPGVRVGFYTCVGPCVHVTDDIPERTLVLAEQSTTRREWGPQIYGW